MNWTIVTIGKPALAWAKDGVADYTARISKVVNLKLTVLKENGQQRNGLAMLAASEKSLRIVLDERGRQLRSVDFAQWIKAKELGGTKQVSLLIGGADGHSNEVREASDECWSLSSFTLQHELALVVLLEQIYRAYSILRGTPYHRE